MDERLRTVHHLVSALSSPFEDMDAQEAARSVLGSPAPGAVLNTIVPVLMRQKTIWLALQHLARAGGDLGSLTIATSAATAVYPLNQRSLWPMPAATSLVVGDLMDSITRHHQLQWKAVLDLRSELRDESFILLSGRAMESRFPAYRGRLGYDVDLWFSQIPEALSALELLVGRLGFRLRYAGIDRPVVSPSICAAVVSEVDGFEVNVGVINGSFRYFAYERFSQPHHGSFDEDLDRRSVEVRRNGLSLKAPSSEDLLLMLAAGIRRKRHMKLINMADAAVILRDSDRLDTSLVSALSKEYGLDVELGVLLASVERWKPGLLPSGLQHLALAAPGTHVWLSSMGARLSPARRAEAWAFEVSDIRSARNSTWLRSSCSWAFQELAKLGSRAGGRPSSAMARESTPFSTSLMPMCALMPSDMRPPSCIATSRDHRWSDEIDIRIKEAATRLVLLMGSRDHDCSCLKLTGLSSSQILVP